MTNEMKQLLRTAGLSEQQISTKTAETVVNALTPENVGALLRNAVSQLDCINEEISKAKIDCSKIVADTIYQRDKIIRELKDTVDRVNALANAVDGYNPSDASVRNALWLYSSIVKVGTNSGADGNHAIRPAGYAVYALLAGEKADPQISPLNEKAEHERFDDLAVHNDGLHTESSTYKMRRRV